MPLKLLLLHNINCLGSFVRSSLLCTLKGITSAHSRPSPSLFHHQPSLFSLCLSVRLSLSLYIYVFIYIQVYVYHVMSINDHIGVLRGEERKRKVLKELTFWWAVFKECEENLLCFFPFSRLLLSTTTELLYIGKVHPLIQQS